MNKKGYALIVFLLIFSLNLISLVSSAENTTESRAIACIQSKTNAKCNSLTTEEKIFSVLATGKCKTELIDASAIKKCWPESGCNVKTTAQAALALKESGETTAEAESWLIDQTSTFKNLDWFLQVETVNTSECKIESSKGSATVRIGQDKKINKNAGSCLTVYKDYWFKIASSCYNEEFTISCNDSFITSTFYKKKDSTKLFILEKFSSGSAEGTTKEKVKSSCFADGSSCSYEGTLWAATVLKNSGRDVSAYLPYLISQAEENSRYLPESFLYLLTDEFKLELLAKQKGEGKWWSESGNKLYDTAVALLPFQNDNSLSEKTSTIDWLEETQSENGCWQDSLKDTAFLVYSLWMTKTTPVANLDCKNSGYFCRTSTSCSDSGDNLLEGYSGCGTLNICCDKKEELLSCSDQNAELCNSSAKCIGGSEIPALDATSAEVCCYEGECIVPTEEEPTPTSTCELNSGMCRGSCLDSEKETTSYSCTSDYQSCCIKKDTPSWIPLLIGILILLVLIAIVMRNKLKLLFTKGKKPLEKNPNPQNQNPKFPPSSTVYPGAIPRRVIPNNFPQQRRPLPPNSRPPVQRPNKEVEDVLKKLKDISK